MCEVVEMIAEESNQFVCVDKAVHSDPTLSPLRSRSHVDSRNHTDLTRIAVSDHSHIAVESKGDTAMVMMATSACFVDSASSLGLCVTDSHLILAASDR